MRRVDGVVSTTAGYTGGDAAGATHAAVSAGRTGHTEAVRVEFDPSAVSYDRLLEVFWASHDPTQFALEAGEPAPPGRSVIYYHTDAQRAAAEASKARVRSSDRYAGAPLPTEILPAGAFFRAEAEHQQYLDRNGSAASCAAR
jgi:peptide-methionine (S)-S-oxide reductase